MNITQHRQQKDLTKKLHERQTYLHALKDGELLGLYRSLIGDMEIARFTNNIERAQELHGDFDLTEREVYARMAERRTVKGWELA